MPTVLRLLIAPSMLALSLLSAKAAVFMLSCDGAANLGGRQESIDKMELMINLETRTVAGFSGIVAPIDRINENWVIFKGDTSDGWYVEGSLDRITGNLRANKTLIDTKNNQFPLLVSYDLVCQLAKRSDR